MDRPKSSFAMTFLRRRAEKNRSIPTPDLSEVAGDAEMDADLEPFHGLAESRDSVLADAVPDPFEEELEEEPEPLTRPDPKADRLKFLRSYLTSRTVRRA